MMGSRDLTTGRTGSSKAGVSLNQRPNWSRGRDAIHDKSENGFKTKNCRMGQIGGVASD